jgi:hypothetical protein
MTLLLTTMAIAKEEKHSHDFPHEVSKFHDIMSPLWHAESSKKRMDATCEKISDMKSQAKLIKGANGLTTSLDSLLMTCDKDIKLFDEAFHHLHDAFHEVSDKNKKK